LVARVKVVEELVGGIESAELSGTISTIGGIVGSREPDDTRTVFNRIESLEDAVGSGEDAASTTLLARLKIVEDAMEELPDRVDSLDERVGVREEGDSRTLFGRVEGIEGVVGNGSALGSTTIINRLVDLSERVGEGGNAGNTLSDRIEAMEELVGKIEESVKNPGDLADLENGEVNIISVVTSHEYRVGNLEDEVNAIDDKIAASFTDENEPLIDVIDERIDAKTTDGNTLLTAVIDGRIDAKTTDQNNLLVDVIDEKIEASVAEQNALLGDKIDERIDAKTTNQNGLLVGVINEQIGTRLTEYDESQASKFEGLDEKFATIEAVNTLATDVDTKIENAVTEGCSTLRSELYVENLGSRLIDLELDNAAIKAETGLLSIPDLSKRVETLETDLGVMDELLGTISGFVEQTPISFKEINDVLTPLVSKVENLSTKYTTLLTNYNMLLSDYLEVNQKYTELSNSHSELEASHLSLKAAFEGFLATYNEGGTYNYDDYSTGKGN
jgi:hypothetical protein